MRLLQAPLFSLMLLSFSSCFKPEACVLVNGPDVVKIGESASFTSCSERFENHEWTVSNLDDGSVDVFSTPDLNYNCINAGYYMVQLEVSNDDGSEIDRIEHRLYVVQPFLESAVIYKGSSEIKDVSLFMYIDTDTSFFYGENSPGQDFFEPVYGYTSGCSNNTSGKAFTPLPLRFNISIKEPTSQITLHSKVEFNPDANYYDIELADSTGRLMAFLDVYFHWQVKQGKPCHEGHDY